MRYIIFIKLIISLQKNNFYRSSECINASIDMGRSEYQNYDIEDCFFQRFAVFDDNGGVIYMNNLEKNIYANQVVFFNCSVNNNDKKGGAMYFNNPNNECNLRKICALNCVAKEGHFAYIYAKTHNFSHISIMKCSEYYIGWYSLYIESGNQSLTHINSSRNRADIWCAGINFRYPISCFCSFSTFFSNEPRASAVIVYSNAFNVTHHCNVVNNSSPSYGIIVNEHSGNCSFQDCILYYNGNTLFNVCSGSISIINCSISHSGETYGVYSVAYLFTQNVLNIQMRTFQIDFYSTEQCETYIHHPDQTPPHTPIRTYDENCPFSISQTNRLSVVFVIGALFY